MEIKKTPMSIEGEFRRFYESSEISLEDKREVSQFVIGYYRIAKLILDDSKNNGGRSRLDHVRLASTKQVREHVGLIGELMLYKWRDELMKASENFHEDRKSYLKVLFALPIFFAIPAITRYNSNVYVKISEIIFTHDEEFRKEYFSFPEDFLHTISYDSSDRNVSITLKHVIKTLFPIKEFRKLFNNFISKVLEYKLLPRIAFYLVNNKYKYLALGMDENDLYKLSNIETNDKFVTDTITEKHANSFEFYPSMYYISIRKLHKHLIKYGSNFLTQYAHEYPRTLVNTILKEPINIFFDQKESYYLHKYVHKIDARYSTYFMYESIKSHSKTSFEKACVDEIDLLSFISELQNIIILQFINPVASSNIFLTLTTYREDLQKINEKFSKMVSLENDVFVKYANKLLNDIGPRHYIDLIYQIAYIRTYYYSIAKIINDVNLFRHGLGAIRDVILDRNTRSIFRETIVIFLKSIYNIDPKKFQNVLEVFKIAIEEQLHVRENNARIYLDMTNKCTSKSEHFSKYYALQTTIPILYDIHQELSRMV